MTSLKDYERNKTARMKRRALSSKAEAELPTRIVVEVSLVEDPQVFEHFYAFVNGLEVGYYNSAQNELVINDSREYGSAMPHIVAEVVKKRFGKQPIIK